MTATEELRALLDERGVEHYDGTECTLWGYEPTSESTGVYHYAADEIDHDLMHLRLYHVTPAQAVEATLGRGECRIENRNEDWYCTGCGEMVGTYDTSSELCIDGNAIELWRFCPNCGAKVVDA